MLGTRKPIFCTWKAQQKSDFQREIPQYQTILPRPKTTTWPWSSSSRPTNHSKIMISTLQAKATQAFTSPVWQTRLSQTTSNNQHKNERSTSRESYSATPALTPPNATLPNTSPGTRQNSCTPGASSIQLTTLSTNQHAWIFLRLLRTACRSRKKFMTIFTTPVPISTMFMMYVIPLALVWNKRKKKSPNWEFLGILSTVQMLLAQIISSIRISIGLSYMSLKKITPSFGLLARIQSSIQLCPKLLIHFCQASSSTDSRFGIFRATTMLWSPFKAPFSGCKSIAEILEPR